MCGRCRTRIPGDSSAMHPKGRESTHTGYIRRPPRIQDDDVIWEFTDQGLAALNLNALVSVEGREN
jgi:hypothetical protein